MAVVQLEASRHICNSSMHGIRVASRKNVLGGKCAMESAFRARGRIEQLTGNTGGTHIFPNGFRRRHVRFWMCALFDRKALGILVARNTDKLDLSCKRIAPNMFKHIGGTLTTQTSLNLRNIFMSGDCTGQASRLSANRPVVVQHNA